METFWYRKPQQLPASIRWALVFSSVVWSIIGFKHYEPTFFPVIENFTVLDVQQLEEGTALSGEMLKARDCRFKEVVAYSGRHLVDVRFTETSKIVSRLEGYQSWGVWLIVPPVREITLYARHDCVTGTVTTKLFDGLLMTSGGTD